MKKFIHTKLQSVAFRKTLCVMGTLIIALVIFQTGMVVGEHKAAFSYRLGDNYHRNFGEHHARHGMFGMPEEEFGETHGAAGKILSVTPSTLVILGHDNVEKIIMINDKTVIRHFRDEATFSDLHVDDFVVVIGSPNEQSQIAAKFIRILPPPPDFSTRTGTSTN